MSRRAHQNNLIINRLHHTLRFRQDLIIPKSQYLDSLLLQPCIALFIVTLGFHMLRTVKLYAQFLIVTIKIEDIATNWMLTPELRVRYTPRSQHFPHEGLRISHSLPHFSGPQAQVVGQDGCGLGDVWFQIESALDVLTPLSRRRERGGGEGVCERTSFIKRNQSATSLTPRPSPACGRGEHYACRRRAPKS